ncbi:MAG TPA: hypothetical protein PKW63_10065 [Vicinamibacterales bacterium]|nr:hypothetical protein [Vicinamibacterales bacterium]
MRSLSILAFAVLFAACSSPTNPSEPGVMTLAPGESGSARGLTVTFLGVTSDSRCPGDATCVTAGDASVSLETSWLGTRRAFELQLNNPANRSATHGNNTITFSALAPYPFASRGNILPADYRATFGVTRR